MPVATPEDMADAEGPNASLEFGDATKMSALNRESGMLATGGQAGAPPQGGAPAPTTSPAVQAAPPPTSPPVQTPQPKNFSPQKYLAPPKVGKGPMSKSWLEDIEHMASHPNAGPALKALLRVARLGQ